MSARSHRAFTATSLGSPRMIPDMSVSARSAASCRRADATASKARWRRFGIAVAKCHTHVCFAPWRVAFYQFLADGYSLLVDHAAYQGIHAGESGQLLDIGYGQPFGRMVERLKHYHFTFRQ